MAIALDLDPKEAQKEHRHFIQHIIDVLENLKKSKKEIRDGSMDFQQYPESTITPNGDITSHYSGVFSIDIHLEGFDKTLARPIHEVLKGNK